ncbi:MAG: BspA family leucine-rich repeat surface protein, partial [Opitutales bacterium]|nr:BspA family leucine-rich repeat surface protein [Opitutales bacterium]
MEASRLHAWLPTPRLRSPGVPGACLLVLIALHGFALGNQEKIGLGHSGAFTLDTMEPNPMVSIGLADSIGFELDTGGDDGTFRIGADESIGFILNTLDSASSIDLNQAGFSDSGGFRLDTKEGISGFVGTTDTGFADSSVFSLDTSSGNAVAWDLNDTGYADSSGFQLDTRDDSLFGDSSFSDSAGFQLDTRETNEVVDRGYADSGSFQLDTGGHDGSLLFGFSDSGSFQLDTRNRDEVYYGDANTSFADSSGFSLDTRDGNGGSNLTGGELVSVKGTIFYDGVVSGSAYVWAMEANGSKAAEDKISIGEGNYSILVEKGRAYDLKAFIDGNENGLASTGEPWGHYREWNNTTNRFNLLQVDGNLTHIHFNLEDRDTDSDGFLDWVEVEAGTDENNASSFPNTSPHFQSDGNLSVMENQTFVFEFNASDPDQGDSLSYSILHGNDASMFELNALSGELLLITSRDFEFPDDNNSDNVYEFTVQVSDGEGNATLDVNVTVLDVYESSKANQSLNDSNFMTAVNMWFSDEANATATYGHISDWNTSAVTNMYQAFKDRVSFNEEISKWDVSRVKNFSGFFRGAKSFNQDITNWDTSSATTFAEMFRDATSFNQAIGDWNVSSLLSLEKIFWSAAAFNQDLSNWDITGVNTMGHIFASAGSLSVENKNFIHQAFSNNSNWPYDWGIASNQVPKFQSDGNLSVQENQAFIYDFEALDADGDVVTYSLNGGGDAALFELIPSTGHLAFISLPEYKSPTDKNGDNLYEVTLQVSDGQATASLNVVVEVTEKVEVTPNQAPQFHSDGNLSVQENQAFIYDFEALDPDGDVVTYSLLGGDDKEFFKLNEATGGLSFIALRDFETPEDANVDNVYELTIEAGDSIKNSLLHVRVEVLDVPEDKTGDPSGPDDFSPVEIGGLEMFAQDDGWAIYEETIIFDEHGQFHAVITNGYDNPVAGGEYSYAKTGENNADLSYAEDGGYPSFKYSLTFTSDLSGTYTKESDYGDAVSFTSGPFSFKATENGPSTGGGVEAPESLAGLEVEIYFRELMPNGDYEDLGMEVVKFGDFEVSAYDANSQQIEYEP